MLSHLIFTPSSPQHFPSSSLLSPSPSYHSSSNSSREELTSATGARPHEGNKPLAPRPRYISSTASTTTCTTSCSMQPQLHVPLGEVSITITPPGTACYRTLPRRSPRETQGSRRHLRRLPRRSSRHRLGAFNLAFTFISSEHLIFTLISSEHMKSS